MKGPWLNSCRYANRKAAPIRRMSSSPPHSQRPNRVAEMLRANVDRLRAGEMEFRIQAVTGHCDLRNLRRQDGSWAEACLYGPGGGGNPHVADEFYHLSHFVPVAQNVASTLLQLFNT